MPYAGKLAKVRKSGTSTAFTGEATTVSEGYTVYQITNTAKRVLDNKVKPTVYKDGVEVNNGYSVDHLNGKVTFDIANDPTEVIILDGKYMPMADVAEAHEFEANFDSGLLNVPVFDSDYNRNIQAEKSIKGSISEWVTIDFYFVEKLISGEKVVIELYPQADQTPIKCWALISSDELKAIAGGEQDQSVNFESDGKISF